MKHVVSGAQDRRAVLVTGFGAFPGAPRNPTIDILSGLEAMRPRLQRFGIRLGTGVLPVIYAEMEGALRHLVEREQPDAILHLGLALRRRTICVETRASNRSSRLKPDAAGGLPPLPMLAPDGPHTLATTYDGPAITAAIRRLGQPVRLSRSAGDYVCNALLHHSLRARTAKQVGFIHMPLPTDLPARHARCTLSTPELTEAIVAAILVMAGPPVPPRASAPKEPTTGVARGDP